MEGHCKPFIALTGWNMGMLDFPVESSALGTVTYSLLKVQNLKYALGNADLHILNPACGALKNMC